MPLVKPHQRVRQHQTGVGIIKEAEGGVGRMVCPRCHQVAGAQDMPDGRRLFTCPRGHRFVSGIARKQ